ncbi:MAG: hypothetical protein ACHQ6T_14740 [Myxococcota bacterium]
MRSRRSIDWCVLATAAALLLAGPARAFPILFDRTGANSGYGVSAATASAVEAAGFRVIEGASVYPASSLDLQIPAPDVLHATVQAHPSVANPTTAQSRWSVTDGGKAPLDDAWLVFLRPVTYTPSKVGIDLQPGGRWALVEVSVGDGDPYFYPAVFLGDANSGAVVQFLMNHVVGEKLTQQGSKLFLPQYSVGVLEGVPLPEPAALVILAAAFALVGAVRRGKD